MNSYYWPFLDLEIKRARNWLRSNWAAKLVVIVVMLVVMVLVLVAEYGMANTYFTFLATNGDFGVAIAQYSINASVFLIFWIAVASSWSISNRFLYQTRYLAQVMTAPLSMNKVFNSRLLMVLLSSIWTMWLLIPILIAYGIQFAPATDYWLKGILVLGCLSLASMAVGVMLNMLMVGKLGSISRVKTMVMAAGFGLLTWGLIKIIFPPQFGRLYYAKDWGTFKSQLEALPLTAKWVPFNWLGETITQGWSGKTGAAVLLVIGMGLISWWVGKKTYLASWRKSYQTRLWADRGLPILKRRSNFPQLAKSRWEAIITNLFLGLIRSSAETGYVIFLGGLLLVVLFLTGSISGLERSAPQFVPWVQVLAFGGLVHLWLLLTARLVYPLMAKEKLTGWLVFSSPLKKDDLLAAQMWFAGLLSWPALVTGWIAGLRLNLDGLTAGWYGLMIVVTVLGIGLCQLFWGTIKPNFAEADNPETASTSGSGLAALGWSLGLMLLGCYHAYLMLGLGQDGFWLLIRLMATVILLLLPLGWWARKRLYGYEI